MQAELAHILHFWQTQTIDNYNGGFYGQITGDNKIVPHAPKGAVLNARILWTFSAAYRITKNDSYRQTAQRAKDYILQYFIDNQYGGVYWLIDSVGKPLDTKKQIYALAFTIYALVEYYKITHDETTKGEALKLYQLIEEHSFDPIQNGYFEAFNREWGQADDLRLSAKDQNDAKTMNTHLHILEAYTNLYRIHKDETLRQKLQNLIHIFTDKIIHAEDFHFRLFFDEKWTVTSQLVSFGHDIEGSWLLLEAAEVLCDTDLLKKVKQVSLKMADVVLQTGFNADNSLMYEHDLNTNHLDNERHWWVQAEAVVGMLYAFKISKNTKYAQKAIEVWQYIKDKLIDYQNSEWFWSAYAVGSINLKDDKAGFWKCPYHNSRACMEVIEIIPIENHLSF